MHVYLREDPVDLEMREVDHEGLLPDDSELVPVAFYAFGNERPSFRALLPPETLGILRKGLTDAVQLGLLAEEPEAGQEVHAMVGLALPAHVLPEGMLPEGAGEEEEELEPWQTSSAAVSEAWRGEEHDDDAPPRTVLLAFAPLVRIARRHPEDFGEELADLLESALSGATKPSLEARVDQMLGGI